MSLDQAINFGKVTVSTGYDQTATSIVLAGGQGAKLPDPSSGAYNLVWWNSTDYPDPADDPNVEIVRVTVRSTDTLTVTRAQESTTATQKESSGKIYKMQLGITAKMITDIAAQTGGTPVYNEIVSGSATTFTLAHTPVSGTVRLYAGGNAEPQTGRLLPGAGNDFTISGAVITMLNGSFDAGTILADYDY